jgi:hypothetical protein
MENYVGRELIDSQSSNDDSQSIVNADKAFEERLKSESAVTIDRCKWAERFITNSEDLSRIEYLRRRSQFILDHLD